MLLNHYHGIIITVNSDGITENTRDLLQAFSVDLEKVAALLVKDNRKYFFHSQTELAKRVRESIIDKSVSQMLIASLTAE